MKERDSSLDLLRVILCICVIALHSFYFFGDLNYYVDLLVPAILIVTDGLFFMLSGYFNLEKEFNSSKDIINFYKSKIVNVLIPFLGFVFFWTVWDYLHVNESFNVTEILQIYYAEIMGKSAVGHLWFMYPLFGMLLSTPFLSKMLHSMDEKELKVLWRIAIGFNVVCYFLCMDFNVSFGVLAWIFDGWLIYYFAGYYYRHVAYKESKIKWIILGLLGFAITVLGKEGKLPFIHGFVGATDIQPMFTLFCMGVLFCWDNFVKITNKVASKVILFLSTNTYLIYLFHTRGMEYAVRKLHVIDYSIISGFKVIIGGFIFSLIAAFVVNLVMKPAQKFILKKWLK